MEDNIHAKTDDQLAKWISGWKVGTQYHIMGMMELKRRQERPNAIKATIGVCITILALILAFVAYLE